MTQAILLVGGQGTRLRPLTIECPKPMLPVAGFPCTHHQIARAVDAGIDRIVLGTSYQAEVFESYFDQVAIPNVDIVYEVETEPLGTGGAIRNAAKSLTCGPDEPVVIFNGDILTGLNIEALVQAWRDAEADVALYLTRVEDPRAYGLVPTDDSGRVLAFKEKPTTPEEIITDQINAGCYVFKRSVIDSIPEGRPVSVERETFPELLGNNATVIGFVDTGYWLDLGSPLAFAQGSADLVQGIAPSPLIAGKHGESFVESSARVESSAKLTAGTYVGHSSVIGDSSVVSHSVILDDVTIGSNAIIENSIVSNGVVIGDNVVIRDAVLGPRAHIEADNELLNGVRVFPDAHIKEATVRFSSDR